MYYNLNKIVGVSLCDALQCLKVSNRSGCSPFVNHVLTSYSSLCITCVPSFVSLPVLLLFPFD